MKLKCKSSAMKFGLLAGLALAASAGAYANTITFFTPTGATAGGQPVDASAKFVTGTGVVDITLTNLEANPTSVVQALSDLDFTLSNGAIAGALNSSSGQQITVNGNGSFTLGSTGSTGWGLNQNISGGLQLDALGFSAPAGLIIGPPGSGGTYSNANGSIAGNGPHNPFLNRTATFVVDVAGVTADTRITSATFSFGTTAGINVIGSSTVPEPSSYAFLLGGLGALIWTLQRRKRIVAS